MVLTVTQMFPSIDKDVPLAVANQDKEFMKIRFHLIDSAQSVLQSLVALYQRDGIDKIKQLLVHFITDWRLGVDDSETDQVKVVKALIPDFDFDSVYGDSVVFSSQDWDNQTIHKLEQLVSDKHIVKTLVDTINGGFDNLVIEGLTSMILHHKA